MRRRNFFGVVAAGISSLDILSRVSPLASVSPLNGELSPAGIYGQLIEDHNGHKRASPGYSIKPVCLEFPPAPYHGMVVQSEPIVWDVIDQQTIVGIRVWSRNIFGKRWSRFVKFSPSSIKVIEGDQLRITYSISASNRRNKLCLR